MRLSRRDFLLTAAVLPILSAAPLAGCVSVPDPHGCSVIEVALEDGRWSVVRPSRYARRVTAATPIRVAGPATGAPAMRTAADPTGTTVLGTFNNCADGHTPWGTYLTCEENYDNYFVNSGMMTAEHRRTGISAKGRGYRCDEFDERFDAGKHPNEPHRHGWVVEFDPYDPRPTPVKRTALGRFSHEGAASVLASDGRLVIYMGDDRSFEYIYKFVSASPVDRSNRSANRDLLDRGTLYAARFDSDGTFFVNIQHPGESPSERSDPANAHAVSTWPDGPGGGRPRSATVVIRRDDGGVIGT